MQFLPKLVFSGFLPYLGHFLSYRDVQYLILILLKNHFDLLKCIFTLGVTVSQIYCKICVLLFLPQTLVLFFVSGKVRKLFLGCWGFIKMKKKILEEKTWLHRDLNPDWRDQSQLCLPPNHRETVLKRPQFLKDTNYEIYWKKRKFSKKLQKIADQLFWNSIFEFFFITKYRKNLIQAWETPKLELSLSFLPSNFVPVKMATINMGGGHRGTSYTETPVMSRCSLIIEAFARPYTGSF